MSLAAYHERVGESVDSGGSSGAGDRSARRQSGRTNATMYRQTSSSKDARREWPSVHSGRLEPGTKAEALDSSRENRRPEESNNLEASGGKQIDDLLNGVVGAVVGGFELLAGW